jgi:hypothetical protein
MEAGMEYRIRVTIAAPGQSRDIEANMERLLDAFHDAHPETGPVAGGNTVHETLDITFALDARDANEAFERARVVFDDGMRASGLTPVTITRIELEVVPEDELQELELQPA